MTRNVRGLVRGLLPIAGVAILFLVSQSGYAQRGAPPPPAGPAPCPGAVMDVQATGTYTQKPVPDIVINGQPAPGAMFHSDRGTQYTSTEFTDLLAANKITQSLSRPRQCWDNAVAESFFASLKLECIGPDPV